MEQGRQPKTPLAGSSWTSPPSSAVRCVRGHWLRALGSSETPFLTPLCSLFVLPGWDGVKWQPLPHPLQLVESAAAL